MDLGVWGWEWGRLGLCAVVRTGDVTGERDGAGFVAPEPMLVPEPVQVPEPEPEPEPEPVPAMGTAFPSCDHCESAEAPALALEQE